LLKVLGLLVFLLLMMQPHYVSADVRDLHSSQSEICKTYNGTSLDNTRFAIIRSSINGVNYKLDIFIPKDYDDSKKYPVIYLLDPHYAFPIAYSIIEALSDRKLIPNVILVGIGYKDNDISKRYVGYETKEFSTYKLNRVRDYTPLPKSRDLKSYEKSYDKHSGNGKKFRKVLSDTIIPYINHTYSTNGNNTLVGHSYGGLFVIFVFLTENRLFSNYLTISPSLWYENHAIFSMVDPKVMDPKTSLYIAVGESENRSTMIDPSRDMYNSIREHSNAKYEILAKEDHIGTLFVGFMHGIRHLLNNLD